MLSHLEEINKTGIHFEEIAAQVGKVSILAASTAASSPTPAAAKLKG
jgi:hypothetical protein